MSDDDPGCGPRRLAELTGADSEEPAVPVQYSVLTEEAEAAMDPAVRDFVAAGAGSGETVRENREAFRRRRILPRLGRDVSSRDLSVELFGRELASPLLLAPIGVQSLVHPEGELATARAAASADVPMILSTASSTPMERVAEAMGDAPRWFQLYWIDDVPVVESLITRAEQSGFQAVVVTIDTPVPPWREATLQRGHVAPRGAPPGNFLADPVVADRLDVDPQAHPDRAIELFQEVRRGQNFTWRSLETLRELTDLPLLVKGVLHPEDATLAVEHGADGLVVSNHGGRQIHGSVAALDALPAVADVVDDEVPVLFDSGIRRGADVVKAMALGAEAVLIGRLFLYGLALAGEEGVGEVVSNLLADLDLTLGMAGFADVQAVDGSVLVDRTGP